MKLKLVYATPHLETLIATAMLTTQSGSRPSTIFHRLTGNPEKVVTLVSGLETQHGSILEHNRISWIVEATDGDVLEILLENRFFVFTRLGGSKWLMSANLRAVMEFCDRRRDQVSSDIIESLKSVAPNFCRCLQGDRP